MKEVIANLENTFLSSDHHFWHRNVIRYCNRPFKDVEEMNEIMIAKWNETVAPYDTVFYLGDFSMAFRSVEVYTRRLNGRKILIPGNHDFCHPAHKKSRNPENMAKWTQNYIDNGWHSVYLNYQFEIPGIANINANHLPYLDPTQDLRHAKFRPNDDGLWLLCGHVHEKWSQRGKMINVGVDVRDFKPMSFSKVVELINTAPNGYPEPKWEAPKEDY